MAETISPVVYGGRTKRYWAVLAVHVLAAGTAAAVVGMALGWIGGLVGLPLGMSWVIAILALAYLLREITGVAVPIPCRRKQVPEWWRTFFSAPIVALLYGLGLGAGFGTPLMSGTLVVVAAAALWSGDPLIGGLLVAPFGLMRAISIVIGPRALEIGRSSLLTRSVNSVALAAVAAAVVAVA